MKKGSRFQSFQYSAGAQSVYYS